MQSISANSFNCLLSSKGRGGNTSCDYVVILSVHHTWRGVNSGLASHRSSAGTHVSMYVHFQTAASQRRVTLFSKRQNICRHMQTLTLNVNVTSQEKGLFLQQKIGMKGYAELTSSHHSLKVTTGLMEFLSITNCTAGTHVNLSPQGGGCLCEALVSLQSVGYRLPLSSAFRL